MESQPSYSTLQKAAELMFELGVALIAISSLMDLPVQPTMDDQDTLEENERLFQYIQAH